MAEFQAIPTIHNFQDFTGREFGRLTVLGHLGKGKWLCRCCCGKEISCITNRLKIGKTKSCGCLRSDVSSTIRLKHGNKRKTFCSPEYTSWVKMKRRCLNSKDRAYHDYGGRGITICQRWIDSFEDFLADMRQRPKGRSLGRIDNDGNYCPENCRWETTKQQARNKRDSRFFSVDGVTRHLQEWSELTGIGEGTLRFRLNSGLEGRELIRPVRGRKNAV